MRRSAKLFLLIVFGAVLYGVPVSQVFVEKLSRGERPAVLSLFDKAPAERHLRAFEKELEESSYVAQSIRPAFQLSRYYLLRELGEKALRGTSGWFFYTPEVRYLAEPYFRELPASVSVFGPPSEADASNASDPVATIVDFSRQLRARKIRLLVVPVPSKPNIYPDRLVPSLKPGPALSTNTRRFVDELRRKRIDLVDLHRVFWDARAREPNLPLYMATDTHWTGDGVRLAAAALAKRIEEVAGIRTKTGGGLEARYTRERVKVERRGDIPRMTRIPRQEALFQSESVICYRVHDRKTGQPYEDLPEAEILLLGDSFSRVFQTDEPEAAGLIANLAFELQQPLASIVNDGGASTLVRQELARDPTQLEGKRLVIWIFAERDIRFGLQGWKRIEL